VFNQGRSIGLHRGETRNRDPLRQPAKLICQFENTPAIGAGVGLTIVKCPRHQQQ
jgi:hypothetical protein